MDSRGDQRPEGHQRRQELLQTIGNTPLVELKHLSPKAGVRIFAKLEGFNPTGSLKDRIAQRILQEAEAAGQLRPGDTIVEASTGNTGISLAFVGGLKGYHVSVVLPEAVMPEILQLLEIYGAEIILYRGKRGITGAIAFADALAAEGSHFTPHQFSNPMNIAAHYEATGPEILRDLPQVDVFIAGLGTGGTLMGVGKRLKEHNAATKVIAVEPHPGAAVQGMRSLADGYIPPILDLSLLDGKFLASSRTAFAATRELWRQEGLLVGVSSGAVASAAIRVAQRLERGNIVALFADSGWKYLGTDRWRRREEEPEDELEDVIWW